MHVSKKTVKIQKTNERKSKNEKIQKQKSKTKQRKKTKEEEETTKGKNPTPWTLKVALRPSGVLLVSSFFHFTFVHVLIFVFSFVCFVIFLLLSCLDFSYFLVFSVSFFLPPNQPTTQDRTTQPNTRRPTQHHSFRASGVIIRPE